MKARLLCCALLLPLLLSACGREEKAAVTTAAEIRVAAVRAEASDNGVRFLLDSPAAYPVTVTVKVESSNLKSEQRLPYNQSMRNARNLPLFEMRRADAARPFDYRYEARWGCGDKRAVHDNLHVYRLPFQVGSSFVRIQGPGGEYSHQGAGYYSYDFGMPEGTPVLAARAGVVCSTKSDSNVGGPDRRYQDDANYVQVVHDDGTVGWYLHLQQHRVNVQPGEQVAAGQLLGFSGNTGFSAQPHLHFQVHRPLTADTYRALQLRIATSLGVKDRMEQGELYGAVEP